MRLTRIPFLTFRSLLASNSTSKRNLATIPKFIKYAQPRTTKISAPSIAIGQCYRRYSNDASANSVQIRGTTVMKGQSLLQVNWSSGHASRYPFVWLRDNCQCEECFHPVSLSRTFYLKNLDLDIKANNVQIKDNKLLVDWSDGHRGVQSAEWLWERAFEEKQRAERKLMLKLPRKPWREDLPVVDWKKLLEDDAALLEWLELLETYGLVLVEGAPAEAGHTRTLAERVAFVKRTHYGEVFSVIAKRDPSNVAYSSATLALHLDLPYYQYKPGVQFIHCVIQHEGEGGDSQMSDALTVAKYLRETQPEYFDLLSTIPVDWVDKALEDGRDYFKMLKQPVICLEKNGRSISRINFSQPQRDSFFTSCPVDKVDDWYRALKAFHDLLYDPKFCRTFKMKPGTLMTLDNLRVVHGRTGYPNTDDVKRHIEGCYLDWDEVRSKRRLLSLKYPKETLPEE